MKIILYVVCLFVYIQTSSAQKFIEYNGREYYERALIIQDSTIMFYPVDEAKVTAVGGVSAGDVTIPVSIPNYPKDHYRFSNRMAIYPTLTIKNVEVEDTAANQRKVDMKRQYAEYRLKVVQAVKSQVEAIKALKGEKLTDEKQIFIFNELMKRHGGPWGDKEKEKLKVGKNCMNAIPIYMKELDEEADELQSFLNLTDRGKVLTTTIAKDGYTGDGREMGTALGIPSPIERHEDVAYNYANYTERLKKKKIDITIKNPLLADEPVTVFNPWYEGIGAEEWKWLQNVDKNGGLEHVVTLFPKEENYYKSDKYPDYRFHYNDDKRPYVLDKDGKLIGVAVNYSYAAYEDEEKMKGATMLYDFEHNAYNIKSESEGVRRWAYYLINEKLGINTEPGFERDAMGMMLGVGSIGYEMEVLHRLYAYRQINKAEYDRKMAALNAKSKSLNRKTNTVSKKYPSDAEMQRAKKFIEQLERDYYSVKLFSNIHVERLNGIQVMLVSEDRKLKVLKTYSTNAKEELKASYVTIEK